MFTLVGSNCPVCELCLVDFDPFSFSFFQGLLVVIVIMTAVKNAIVSWVLSSSCVIERHNKARRSRALKQLHMYIYFVIISSQMFFKKLRTYLLTLVLFDKIASS